MIDFQKTYDEIFKNFHKRLAKQKSIQEATYFLCVSAMHLRQEAKNCIERLKSNESWEKAPKVIQEFLESIQALDYDVKQTVTNFDKERMN